MAKKLLLLCAGILMTHPAWAENATQVSFGCAPWDGATLEIAVKTADTRYQVTLWGRGLTALQQGVKAIAIAAAGDMNGNGRAAQCPAVSPGTRQEPCPNSAMTVVFDRTELKEGGTVAGHLEAGPASVPFSGTIVGGHQLCG